MLTRGREVVNVSINTTKNLDRLDTVAVVGGFTLGITFYRECQQQPNNEGARGEMFHCNSVKYSKRAI